MSEDPGCDACGHLLSEHDSWSPLHCQAVDLPISIDRQRMVVRPCQCAEFADPKECA